MVNLPWAIIVIHSTLIASVLSNFVAAQPVADSSRAILPSDSARSIQVADSSTRRADSLLPKGNDSTRATAVGSPKSVWSTEFCLGLEFSAIDFAERSRFSSDLAGEASASRWVVDQPYPGSDIGPTLGLEFALRRKDMLRLAAGGSWRTWSAQAVARDTASGSLHDRSYGSDLFLGSLGADFLVSRSVLRLDAARDAFVGARWLVGAGRLTGSGEAWGLAMGASMRAGADFLDWGRWALSAHLGLDWISMQSQIPWRDVLKSSSSGDKVAWTGGGLSLGLQLRWGAPGDSIPGKAQKK